MTPQHLHMLRFLTSHKNPHNYHMTTSSPLTQSLTSHHGPSLKTWILYLTVWDLQESESKMTSSTLASGTSVWLQNSWTSSGWGSRARAEGGGKEINNINISEPESSFFGDLQARGRWWSVIYWKFVVLVSFGGA